MDGLTLPPHKHYFKPEFRNYSGFNPTIYFHTATNANENRV